MARQLVRSVAGGVTKDWLAGNGRLGNKHEASEPCRPRTASYNWKYAVAR